MSALQLVVFFSSLQTNQQKAKNNDFVFFVFLELFEFAETHKNFQNF